MTTQRSTSSRAGCKCAADLLAPAHSADIRFSRTVAVVYRVPTYTLFLKTAQVFGRVISVDSGAKEMERSTILLLYQPSFDPAVHAAYLDIRWRPLVQHLQHLLEYFLYSTHQHQLSQQFLNIFGRRSTLALCLLCSLQMWATSAA